MLFVRNQRITHKIVFITRAQNTPQMGFLDPLNDTAPIIVIIGPLDIFWEFSQEHAVLYDQLLLIRFEPPDLFTHITLRNNPFNRLKCKFAISRRPVFIGRDQCPSKIQNGMFSRSTAR